MRYCFRVFLCSLSQRLKSPGNWLILLLLPVCILAANHLTGMVSSSPVTVGVVLPESGAEQLWELLESHSNEIMTFVAADADTVDRNVAAGKWDCGFLFAPDFAQRVEKLDLKGSVTVRIAPGSAAYPLVQETVSACITRLAAPAIAHDYLLDSGITAPESLDLMEQKLDEIRSGTPRIDVNLATPDGSTLQVPELAQQSMDQFLYWLICAVILVRMLFGAADLAKWGQSAAGRRLQPLQPVRGTLTAKAAADCLLMTISGSCAMLLQSGSGWGCLAVAEYTLLWTFISVLLARFPRIHQALPVCVPFALVTSFLLSSVLVDIGMILPALSGISRWLPVTLYLRGCGGSVPSLLILPAATLVCVLASCAIDWLDVLQGGIKHGSHKPSSSIS